MTLKMINRVWRGKWKKRNGISWLRDQESKLHSRSMSPLMADFVAKGVDGFREQ